MRLKKSTIEAAEPRDKLYALMDDEVRGFGVRVHPASGRYPKGRRTFFVRAIAEVAKILGTGQNRLYVRLRETKILQSNNLPYQHYLNSDYFGVCAGRFQRGENGRRTARPW